MLSPLNSHLLDLPKGPVAVALDALCLVVLVVTSSEVGSYLQQPG